MSYVKDLWSVEKKWIQLLAVLFLLSSLIGYFSSQQLYDLMMESGFMEPLEKMVQQLNGNPTFLSISTLIFTNNLFVALQMIGLGLFFGFFPLFGILGNGLLLGMMLKISAVQSGLHPLWLFTVSILPHGILELPALVLASAVGVHIGWLFIQGIRSFIHRHEWENTAQKWREMILRIPLVISMITILLVLAAVIESGLIYFY